MKKALLLVVLGIISFVGLQAQEQTVVSKKQAREQAVANGKADGYVGARGNIVPKGFVDAIDLSGSYSSKTDIIGIKTSMDINKYTCGVVGWDFGVGSNTPLDYSMLLGYGLKKRLVLGDFLLLQGKLYPYLGYSMSTYTEGWEEETEFDFLYGASCQLDAGIRIYRTKKGTDLFLTAGYEITAPEFETTDMIDNGRWQFGLTWFFGY